jgi:hypothetical protein
MTENKETALFDNVRDHSPFKNQFFLFLRAYKRRCVFGPPNLPVDSISRTRLWLFEQPVDRQFDGELGCIDNPT